jgi:hypothetical protein
VLAVAGLSLGVLLVMVVGATVTGTDGMTVSFGAVRIVNPALWQVVAVAVLIGRCRSRRNCAIGTQSG